MYLILQNNPARSANGSVPDAGGGGAGGEVVACCGCTVDLWIIDVLIVDRALIPEIGNPPPPSLYSHRDPYLQQVLEALHSRNN